MYYPKSQIKTDLYTNGGKFITSSDGNEYKGYYFSTANGLYFTGRNPNDKPNNSLELSSIPTPNPLSESNILTSRNESYYSLPLSYSIATNNDITNNTTPPSIPKQTIVLPTTKDYNIQEYQRFFVKKNNEVKYIEISQIEFDRYSSQDKNVSFQLYTPFSFPWVIAGDRTQVFQINKNTINRISNNLSLIQFPSYFKNRYDQYFRYSPKENLKTDGTEFRIKSNNKPYIGLYHVHPEKGPMVGAQHIDSPHSYLIPISGSNINYKTNTLQTQTIQTKGIRSSGY